MVIPYADVFLYLAADAAFVGAVIIDLDVLTRDYFLV